MLTAALEVAFNSTSRMDLLRWAQVRIAGDEGDKPLTGALEVTYTVIRLARQLLLLLLSVVATVIGIEWFGGWSILAVLGWVLALYLLIDKVLPFLLVGVFGAPRVLRIGQPLIALLRIVLGGLSEGLHHLYRGNRSRSDAEPEAPIEGDLDAFLDLAEEEGLVSEIDEALLRGVADFGEAVVREVMTPRVDMISIQAGATIEDLATLVNEHKFSRVPVVRETVDQVAGVVNIKDLVENLAEGSMNKRVTEIARPAIFVPETKRVRELLSEFQHRREHLAIVVDEYGGTAGLVSIEDLLEEIVGEIQDEYEDEDLGVVEQPDGTVIADGKAEIEEIERALQIELGDTEFETVGGMAFVHLGYVPKPGDEFNYHGLHVTVLEADDRRVHRVRIARR
jgi:CBS domain containing-hemolysin-like protein